MTQLLHRLARPAVAALMIGLLAVLALTDTEIAAPTEGEKPSFAGIVPAAPGEITHIELASKAGRFSFRRDAGGAWRLDRPENEALPPSLASHLEAALQFMHVSTPARSLGSADYQATNFGEFGLDPPAYVVSLVAADHTYIANFGASGPAGASQYVRVLGRPTLYLLPRHVGQEWEVAADMVQRREPPNVGAAPQAARAAALLLPTSMDRVWALEILFAGQLHRFERDDAGRWLLHVAQHTHANGQGHVAEPAQAVMISKALEAFANTQIESVVAPHAGPGELDRYGLSRPAIVAELYARDTSLPLVRVEIGRKADDGFSRAARLAPDGDVIAIADYQADRLIALLRAVGAIS